MTSPAACSSGLAKGSGSLIKGTVGGLMSAASAVTNSASKVMATASGDEAFMASQAAARSGHQPEHLADGLKMGVTALGNSLFSGVTGVFLDPLAGARKEGVLGFGKGLVKGVAGLAFKPVSNARSLGRGLTLVSTEALLRECFELTRLLLCMYLRFAL